MFYVIDGKTKIRAAFEHAGAVLESGEYKAQLPGVDHDLHLIQVIAMTNSVTFSFNINIVGGDPYCKFEQFWIEIEAGPLENGENARALWTKIESKLKASSESWLARVALEK
jgi:hypothetical protein